MLFKCGGTAVELQVGVLLGTLDIRCRTIIGTRKGTTILTTTHVGDCVGREVWGLRGHSAS